MPEAESTWPAPRGDKLSWRGHSPADQVGDDSGMVNCFEVKRREAQCSFSFSFGGAGGGGATSGGGGVNDGATAMVTALTMGGVTGGPGGGERVFTTQVSRVPRKCSRSFVWGGM